MLRTSLLSYSVPIYHRTTLLGTATSAPYSFSWVDVAAGTYSFTAKATDSSNQSRTSVPVQVTVAGGGVQAYYIYSDQLNTPRLIKDQNNNTVWQWDNNDPFGSNVANEAPGGSAVPFTFNPRFPGQYFDKETNLHYNYFRDYDPQTGRYVQSDPIGLAGGLNTYSYVAGNPISKIDIDGLKEGAVSMCMGKIRNYEHVWLCAGDQCAGLMPNGSFVEAMTVGRGVVAKESYNAQQCTEQPPPKICKKDVYEKCVADKTKNIGAKDIYGVLVHNCMDWATETLNFCMAKACF